MLGLLLPLLSSCLDDDEYVDYAPIDNKIILNYLKENNIDAESDVSGLYYKVVNPGTGASIGQDQTQDDQVTFSYKGYLTNGQVFADTKGENITSHLSQLLYSMQIGMSKINREGEIHLYSPSHLAYGSAEKNNVPANSVVIFEIKIDRDQKDIDEDLIADYLSTNKITDAIRDQSGLYYQITKEGDGNLVPENAIISVSYTGTLLDGNKFDEGTLTNASLSKLISAWQIGIPKLKKGSHATFYCPSQMAYGHEKRDKIPANSILVFNIQVIDFI